MRVFDKLNAVSPARMPVVEAVAERHFCSLEDVGNHQARNRKRKRTVLEPDARRILLRRRRGADCIRLERLPAEIYDIVRVVREEYAAVRRIGDVSVRGHRTVRGIEPVRVGEVARAARRRPVVVRRIQRRRHNEKHERRDKEIFKGFYPPPLGLFIYVLHSFVSCLVRV